MNISDRRRRILVNSQQIESVTMKLEGDVNLERQSASRGRDEANLRLSNDDTDGFKSPTEMKNKRKP